MCAPRFNVNSGDAKALAGIDGEALQLDAPLRMESRPRGLRVLVPLGTPREIARRTSHSTPGLSKRLWNVAHGLWPDQESV